MFKVKLIKGLSYTGVVHATKEAPYVDVEAKATSDALVASGYFELVGENKATEKGAKKAKASTKSKEVVETESAADYGDEE